MKSKKGSAKAWTLDAIDALQKKGKIKEYKITGLGAVMLPVNIVEDPQKKKRSKFGNIKTEVDGILFDSMKEARRYKMLLLLVKAGVIRDLLLQQRYALNVEGELVAVYIADFVYIDAKTGDTIVEDVKSKITRRHPVYRIKKKLMKSIYKISIKET